MKKIAFVLAMLIAMTGCLLALASCGEEETSSEASAESKTESVAESKEESAASSEAADESSEEESVEDESSEETEEPVESADPSEDEPSADDSSADEPDESSEEDEVSVDVTPIDPDKVQVDMDGASPNVETATGTNLAVGCTYAGADLPNNPELQTYSGSLTDEICPLELDYNNEWFAYWYNTQNSNCDAWTNAPGGDAVIVLDLGSKEKINLIRLYMFVGNASGIAAPSTIKFEYSENGTDYISIGSQFFGLANEDNEGCRWVGFKLPIKVSARYVRVSMKCAACWTFMNELEVY